MRRLTVSRFTQILLVGVALVKFGEFANKYVASGGEDVGYEAVDQAKIEDQVKHGAATGLNALPLGTVTGTGALTLDQIRRKAVRAVNSAADWTKRDWSDLLHDACDAAESKALESGVEKGSEAATKALVRAGFPSPAKPGFDAGIKAERQRLSKILEELDRPKPDPKKELLAARPSSIQMYAKDQATNLGQIVGKYAAKRYEEGLWRANFRARHSVTSPL